MFYEYRFVNDAALDMLIVQPIVYCPDLSKICVLTVLGICEMVGRSQEPAIANRREKAA